MRSVVLDTETTGLSVNNGDRIVEVGCVELIDYRPTGRIFHSYINPQRPISYQATLIHGIELPFAKRFRRFQQIAPDLIAFLEGAELVAHNAGFDRRFIHQEIIWSGIKPPEWNWVDTMSIYKKMFPGSPLSLDMMCAKFKIKNDDRQLHGALKDAQLLAQCYWHLTGGNQLGLPGNGSPNTDYINLDLPGISSDMVSTSIDMGNDLAITRDSVVRPHYPRRDYRLLSSPEERQAHKVFMKEIKATPF